MSRLALPPVGAVAAALLALAAIAAPPAAAATEDYDVSAKDWRGLHGLAQLASSRGLVVEPRDEVAWEELRPGDVVFVLYPTRRLEPAHVAAFLRRGGRLLLADDHGRADETLARLRILRRPARFVTARLHEGNPALPIARPLDPVHPLAAGIDELLTNHPATFAVSPGPDVVFAFAPHEAVVVAGQLGEGRFVALSDPSVLINGMLAFDGNVAFAANLVDFLADGVPAAAVLDDTPRRLFVLSGEFQLSGKPPGADPSPARAATTNELLSQVGQWLDELNDYLAPEWALRWVAHTSAVVVLVVGAIIVPLRRTRRLDGSFARAGAGPGGPATLVARYDDPRGERNFARPAAELRESLDDDALRAFEARAGAEAAARVRRRLERLPTRDRLDDGRIYVSRGEFLAACQELDAVHAQETNG